MTIEHSLATNAIHDGPWNKAGSLFGRFFFRLPLYATVQPADPRPTIAIAEGLAQAFTLFFCDSVFSSAMYSMADYFFRGLALRYN